MTCPASWAVSEVIGSRLGVVGVERVSADSEFCDEPGAGPLVMARFCARVRKRSDLPASLINDDFRNPTIRALAAASREERPFDSDHFRDHHGFAGAATIANARARG